jgi:hypothetical protein
LDIIFSLKIYVDNFEYFNATLCVWGLRLPYKATFLNLFALQAGYDFLTSTNYFTLQLLLRNVVISEIEMAACFRGIELLTFCSDELLA